MEKHYCKKLSCAILFLFLCSGFTVFAQQTTITGTVLDETNQPLPYASVLVQGTTIGTSTDINGKFVLTGVPVGEHTLKISFLGYQTKSVPVTGERGKTTDLTTKLDPVGIQGKEVVITAQVRGQAQAINQQLNAPGIVNVVSQEKIKELPDGNAADAAGRLPGIMVQRSGGEGEKLIIRGLDPKYSTVSVNGVVAPASSATDRSTNMNLISPDIISGIEVSKANTADRDADGMGGTVNLLVKEADMNRRLNVSLQGGYSGQTEEFSNYKATLFFSNRFFDKKLGMMLSGNIESYDRSADRLTVNYSINGVDILPQIGTLSLRATSERRDRYNGSAIFDYSFNPKHVIKMVNMFSQTDRDVFQRRKSYNMAASSGTENQLRFEQISSNPTAYMISNAFDGKHVLGNTELTWAGSFSQTTSRTPNEHTLQFRHAGAFVDYAATSFLDPLEATNPAYTKEDVRLYFLRQGVYLANKNNESEWSGKLDYKIPFSFFNKQLSGNIKLGGKLRIKDRSRETDRWSAQVYGTGTGANSVVSVKDRFLYEPDAPNGVIGLMSFLDPGFSSPRFLNGESPYLNINYAIDRNIAQQFFLNNNPYPMIVPTLTGGNPNTGNLYQYAPNAKVKDDYTAHEELYAGYLMGEINIGKMITFIPGVRYDYQHIKYTAWKGEGIPDNLDADVNLSSLEKQEADNTQIFILPQIHLKVKPLSWFDVRLAYTQTISRPDYDYLAPRTQIDTQGRNINHTTTLLKSSKSENFDVIMSFFNSKYGLFTVGAFRKNISNFIYQREAAIVKDTPTDPGVFGVEDVYIGYNITYPLNNPGKSHITGMEIEGQTNFRWLPGNLRALRGFVLSGNISFMKSRSEYQATRFQFTESGQRINIDTVFVDRLVKQPSLLANISVGYDYKGFSGRISYSYQDDILDVPQQRMDGYDKESVLAFSRWDLQLKQKINKRVSFYFNMTNIFNNADKSIRNVTGYYTAVGYYGMGMNLGVKIDIFK